MRSAEHEQGQKAENPEIKFNTEAFKHLVTKPLIKTTALRDTSFVGMVNVAYLLIDQICQQTTEDSTGKLSAELTKRDYVKLCIRTGDVLSTNGIQLRDHRYHAFAAECFEEACRVADPQDLTSLTTALSFVQSVCNYQMGMSAEDVKSDEWIKAKMEKYVSSFQFVQSIFQQMNTAVVANNHFAGKFQS